MNNRQTTYFGRKKRDREIYHYIKERLDTNDYSDLSKELMYDGIQYRKLKQQCKITEQLVQNPPHTNVIHSHTFPQNVNNQPNKPSTLSGISLDKKQLKEEDALSKLDSF